MRKTIAVSLPLLDYTEAAASLGVTPYTLRMYVASGRIDVVRINRKVVRFTRAALEKFAAEHTDEARR